MAPVIPCSISNVSLTPDTTFITRKNNCLTRCKYLAKSTKQTLSSQRFLSPLSTSVRLFPQYRSGSELYRKSRVHILLATGTDVTVEEANTPIADEDAGGVSEISPDAAETNEESSIKSTASPTPNRSRPIRKSEMPPVKNEELVPGAAFTGKVKSIQPFGAFIDFGAFTDGLVHVSRLSDSFVKDVGSIVTVGQEVKVRLVEANTETGRISLTMRDSDDISKLQQQKDAPAGSDKARPSRRNSSKSNQKRDEVKRSSKFIKGQDLEGTVKNLTRAGAFISLPEGDEGFLPTSEEVDEGFGNIMGGSSLQVGQEVSVRVLRVARGQVTLTMKKEEDVAELDSQLNQGVVHVATNPFMLAFRKNQDIATFLDEREKVLAAKITEVQDQPVGSITVDDASTEIANSDKDTVGMVSILSESVDGAVQTIEEEAEVSSEILDPEKIANSDNDPEGMVSIFSESVDGAVQTIEEEAKVSSEILDPEKIAYSDKDPEGMISILSEGVDGAVQTIEEKAEVSSEILDPEKIANSDKDPEGMVSILSESVDGAVQTIEEEGQVSSEILDPEKIPTSDKDPEGMVSILSEGVDGAVQTIEEEAEVSSEILDPEGSVSTADQIIEEAPTKDGMEDDMESDSFGESADQILSSESPSSKEVIESLANDATAEDEVQIQTPTAENKIPPATPVEDVESIPEKNGSITSSSGQSDESTAEDGLKSESKAGLSGEIADGQTLSSENRVSEDVVENQVDNSIVKDEVKTQTPAAESDISSAAPVEDENVGSIPEKNGTVSDSNGQTCVSSPKESMTTAAISPALVKQLREETGAGMMDCKKALAETGGDIIKAQEFLRKKGLASADKKASRATAEGRIGSYIHDSRIGILIEVNCETDFVSRGDIFKELVDDLAMQAAAYPQVQYLVPEDVPEGIVSKEREIEMQKEDLLSKPEQIRSKIVEGRIRKRLEELALLEQPYIKNDKVIVKDWVKQTIATIGENIKVKRFVRYNLGEGLEKKSQDFAAEVAAQTATKSAPAPGKEQPAAVEAKETVEKPPTVTVSAALVKQLREETGAGMMDCKKALSETGGDLEKAQEYLRKKGLSTAAKKSSRLAAEGRIGSYIHDSRIGVLLEVNCETDFVGRSEKFKELVDDLAMQVVACPQVEFVSIEDIPESIVSKEKELEMQREDLQSKPENIRERIVEGRISKRLGELALSEQPFIKNDSILVKDLVKQTVAALGENIKIRRFVRFTLGEEIESAQN